MTNAKRVTLLLGLGVVTGVAAAGFRIRGQEQPQLRPATVTYQEVHYGPAGQITFARTQLLGVRSDGSTSRADFHSAAPGRPSWFLVRIADAHNHRLYVVDQLTKSVTTYPTLSQLKQYEVQPASSCAGTPDGTLLGLPVFF